MAFIQRMILLDFCLEYGLYQILCIGCTLYRGSSCVTSVKRMVLHVLYILSADYGPLCPLMKISPPFAEGGLLCPIYADDDLLCT